MARRRYFRRVYRTAPKKKWASNVKQGGLDNLGGVVLVENSSQSSTPTPVIVKAGNFKIQGDTLVSSNTQGTNVFPAVFIFLLYAPEGIGSDSSALSASLQAHPEWIMGWTSVDTSITNSTSYTSGNKFSITSRLKRNLNSGDRIYLFAQSASGTTISVHYTAQFFTCAN